LRFHDSATDGGFEVTATGMGLTGRAGTGSKVAAAVRDAIRALDADAWQLATAKTAPPRGAAVAELTDTVELASWPAGSLVIVRRGTTPPWRPTETLDDIDGVRFTRFLTDQTDTDLEQSSTPPPRPRPRRGPHPRRQRHRRPQPALRHLRPQRRLARARPHGSRPDGPP